MKSIKAKELKKILENKELNIQVIDVRSKSEWDEGHIVDPRVTNVEVNSLVFDNSQVSKDKEVYLICESGGRSSFAQMILGTKGINCINVEDGMSAFRKS